MTSALQEFGLELEHQRAQLREALQTMADGVTDTAADFSEYEQLLKTTFDNVLGDLD